MKLEIFKPGKRIDSSGTERDITATELQKTARAYNTDLHEAPLVVGHPQSNDPAYGWVAGLAFADGSLHAVAQQVETQFSELVQAGRYKKVSASFYLPDAPTNPVPGTYYLRHVGFLGAQPPAVKGLKPAEFSDDDPNVITFEESIPMPPEQKPSPSPTATDFTEREAALAEQERKLKEREAAITAAERKHRLATHASFAEGLVKEGKLLPNQKARVTALLAGLPNDTVISFAEGDETKQQSPSDILKSLLSELPNQVEYQELSKPKGDDKHVANFAVPDGYQVDSDDLELHNKIVAYQKQHGCDYDEALNAVVGG